MEVCAYARVSTTDQECGYQLTEIREYASRRGWTIVKEFVDTGWSGSKKNRPALSQLMVGAARREFDCVLVQKLDRFGRSVLDVRENLSNLAHDGVRFIAVSQGIDTDQRNAGANLLLNMLAAVAEFEVEIIRERVQAGLHHARTYGTKSGKSIGRPKRIFRRDEAIDLRAQGVPFREIAKRFNVGVGTVLRACTVPKPLSELPRKSNEDGDLNGLA